MKSQRRFAPEGGRNESESVAGFIGISICQYMLGMWPNMTVICRL